MTAQWQPLIDALVLGGVGMAAAMVCLLLLQGMMMLAALLLAPPALSGDEEALTSPPPPSPDTATLHELARAAVAAHRMAGNR